MSAMVSMRLESVTVDFSVYNSSTRSLRNRLLHRGTGGRIARGAGRRLLVRALEDVSLSFEHGDRVGLIGPNGAGKTTLLRVLAGTYEPGHGRVYRHGRTASLLSVSLAINPEATGYENILTRGLFLGLLPEQVRERMDEIAEFTELGDYLAMPVHTYSAGMRLRLAFGVCTCFEPRDSADGRVAGHGRPGLRREGDSNVSKNLSNAPGSWCSHPRTPGFFSGCAARASCSMLAGSRRAARSTRCCRSTSGPPEVRRLPSGRTRALSLEGRSVAHAAFPAVGSPHDRVQAVVLRSSSRTARG